MCLFGQTPERNYVLTRTYKQPGATEAQGNTYWGTPDQVHTQISYFNGLGLPQQQVDAFVGPSGQDLISQTSYDNQYRPNKTYLPAAAASNNGRFVSSPNYGYYGNSGLV
ncbi:hypothetical protein GCM10027291_46420 [Telluribacter humicola]